MRRRASGLLAFVLAANLQAQGSVPAGVSAAIAKADAAVARLVAIPTRERTFENTVLALDEVKDDLNTEVGLRVYLQYVSPDARVREEAREADEAVRRWSIALGKNEAVYRAVSAYAATSPKREGLEARLLALTLRDYRRGGMGLASDRRDRLAEIERQIAKNEGEFARNIAEDETVVAFTRKELVGLPPSRLEGYPKSGDLCLVTVGPTDALAVLGSVRDPLARRKFYLAANRRGGRRNVEILEATLKLRAEQASILGYASPAAYELEPRMAKSPEAIAAFYERLRPLARQKARRDYDELLALKRKDVKSAQTLDLWDVDYYGNRLKAERYKVDSERVSEYFPADATFKGMLGIASTLYGIEFKDVAAGATELWHPDVKKVAVTDKRTGKPLGTLYLDLFPRPNKETHPFCTPLVTRRRMPDGEVRLPVAALMCSFTPPTRDKPSLLPHEEVVVLFHEFGHALHDVLSETTIARFESFSMELDFVEAPSQMFENWASDPKVLGTFARHYRTGEPLPEETLKALSAASKVGSGLLLERREVQAIADQRYHTATGGFVDTTKVWNDTLKEVSLFSPLEGAYFQAGWTHPMSGYQAGYYSYVWSKVYAQDMFQRFEREGLLNPEAGAYYRAHILAKGGMVDAMDMVRDYLGREPGLDAFLRDLDLSAAGK